MSQGPVSDELYNAIVRAQVHTHVALNLCYKETTSLALRLALGRAQSLLMFWQARLAERGNRPTLPVEQ